MLFTVSKTVECYMLVRLVSLPLRDSKSILEKLIDCQSLLVRLLILSHYMLPLPKRVSIPSEFFLLSN